MATLELNSNYNSRGEQSPINMYPDGRRKYTIAAKCSGRYA